MNMKEFFMAKRFGGGSGGGVPINNQDKAITQNGTYSADEGYTGLGTVNVNVESLSDSEWEEPFIRAIERDASKPITEIPDGLTSIGGSAFSNCPNLALTELPDGLTSIGDSAFALCPNLALTKLPDGVTSIGSSVFSNCTNLALTELPDGLTSIGGNAFGKCTNLALTELPDGLTSIGGNAFFNCTNLSTITFKGKPTGKISSSAFGGCTNLLTINVPWAEGEVANAPWGATNATINYNYTGG